MGNFYVNYTLRGLSQQDVAAAVADRRARVTPVHNNCVVVFDEASDSQNATIIGDLASKLSRKFACPVLAVLDHDDDILWYQLYEKGELTDEYDSTPGYFDTDAEPSTPGGGDAARLCAAFGGDAATVDTVLRGGYVFAFERHAAMVQALGISDYAVGTSYESFDCDELPEGLAAHDVLETGDGPAHPVAGSGEEASASVGDSSVSALYTAAGGNDAAAIRRLVAAGCPVDNANEGVETPLHTACAFGNAAAAEALLDLGADPNRRYTFRSWTDGTLNESRTALMYASGAGTVKLLISRGGDPNATTPTGVTPLIMATARSDVAAVEELLAAGADPLVEAILRQNGEPRTARQWAEDRAAFIARLNGDDLDANAPLNVIIRLLAAAEERAQQGD